MEMSGSEKNIKKVSKKIHFFHAKKLATSAFKVNRRPGDNAIKKLVIKRLN